MPNVGGFIGISIWAPIELAPATATNANEISVWCAMPFTKMSRVITLPTVSSTRSN